MTIPASPGPARRAAAMGLGDGGGIKRPGGPLILGLAAVSLLLACVILHYGRPVLMPLAVAGLLQFLLAPIVRRLRLLGLPGPFAAGLLLLGLVGLAGLATYHLSAPALRWVDELQDEFWRIEWRLSNLKEPLAGVARASKRVEEMAQVGEEDPDVVVVRPQASSPVRALLEGTLQLATTILVVIFLLFFLLARDGALLRKAPMLIRDTEARERLGEVYRRVEKEISTYLLTITAINVALGVAVGTAMFFYKVPNPLLWGAMACVLNFVPYLGGLVGVTIILVVSLMSDGVINPLLPPLTYVLLNGLEGMVITPLIMGRMLTLSPVAVFLWLILSAWVWGIPGALLAVPLLAVVKLVSDKVPTLQPVGQLLER